MTDNLRLEYSEINQWLRHIELVWWGLGALIIPVTAAFYYKVPLRTWDIFSLGLSLNILWWFYLSFTKFVLRQSLEYMERAKEIEEKLGISFIRGQKTRLNKQEPNEAPNLMMPEGKWIGMRPYINCTADGFRFPQLMCCLSYLVLVMWIVWLLASLVMLIKW